MSTGRTSSSGLISSPRPRNHTGPADSPGFGPVLAKKTSSVSSRDDLVQGSLSWVSD